MFNWYSFFLILLFLISFFTIAIKKINQIKSQIIRRLSKGCFVFLFTVFSIIITKVFALSVYKIPSASMENILFTQDVILVNKLNYGPRLPRSPFDIPLVNIVFYLNQNAKQRMNENWWNYRRLAGTTTIKQGDVFVFNSTWNKSFILVKRCVALPGDTLNIRDTEIYTNDSLFTEPNTVKNNYKFKVKNKTALYKFLDSFPNVIILYNSHKKFHEAKLTNLQLEHLKKEGYIDSVMKQIDTFVPKKTFAKLPSLKWTFDNMGPMRVPKKGMRIALNIETYALYKRAINSSEGCIIEEINGDYFIDGKKKSHYIFRQDYYFMMGDNRKGTLDSRRWGFIPEQNIIGKVQCILYSNYGGKFDWNRLFKTVN